MQICVSWVILPIYKATYVDITSLPQKPKDRNESLQRAFCRQKGKTGQGKNLMGAIFLQYNILNDFSDRKPLTNLMVRLILSCNSCWFITRFISIAYAKRYNSSTRGLHLVSKLTSGKKFAVFHYSQIPIYFYISILVLIS